MTVNKKSAKARKRFGRKTQYSLQLELTGSQGIEFKDSLTTSNPRELVERAYRFADNLAQAFDTDLLRCEDTMSVQEAKIANARSEAFSSCFGVLIDAWVEELRAERKKSSDS